MSQSFTVSVPKLKHEKLVDAAAGKALSVAADYANDFRWWWVNDDEMILDAETGLLWQGKPDLDLFYTVSQGLDFAKHISLGGFQSWRLPTIESIRKSYQQH